MNQYTLNFEPSLPERFPTLREYLAAKYLDNDTDRRARALFRVESLLLELSGVAATLKAAT